MNATPGFDDLNKLNFQAKEINLFDQFEEQS